MSNSFELTTGKDLHFVSLEISREINKNDLPFELFNKKEYCDEFIKTLIFCIENHSLNLYGFVLFSNQVHLIVSAKGSSLHQKIDTLKNRCATEIFASISKKLSAMDELKNRKEKELRRFFNHFVNYDHSSLWEKEDHYVKLHLKNEQKLLSPISSDVLVDHLTDSKRNYLQLGATAFTKLMMDAMSF